MMLAMVAHAIYPYARTERMSEWQRWRWALSRGLIYGTAEKTIAAWHAGAP